MAATPTRCVPPVTLHGRHTASLPARCPSDTRPGRAVVTALSVPAGDTTGVAATGAAQPSQQLPPISVVLVAPKSLENVGAAARAAANYGASRLAIAGPRFAWEDDGREGESSGGVYQPAARRVARGTPTAGGAALLAGAALAPDLASLLPSLGPAWAVAVTRRSGRARSGGGRAWTRPSHLASALLASPTTPPTPLTLVFGREESGLTDEEVSLCGGGTLALPTPPHATHGSLNLGSAVAVALALLAEAESSSSPMLESLPPFPPDAATPADIAALVSRVSALAGAVGLAPGESSGGAHGRKRRSAGIARALLSRAGASRAECAGIHLLLRAVERELGERTGEGCS